MVINYKYLLFCVCNIILTLKKKSYILKSGSKSKSGSYQGLAFVPVRSIQDMGNIIMDDKDAKGEIRTDETTKIEHQITTCA